MLTTVSMLYKVWARYLRLQQDKISRVLIYILSVLRYFILLQLQITHVKAL
jgi:hypothetical protein